MKQKLVRAEKRNRQVHSHRWDFNTPLAAIDRNARQKISKDIEELNNTINQQDLIHVCITLHQQQQNTHFFSNTHGTFTKMGHILNHKTNFKF